MVGNFTNSSKAFCRQYGSLSAPFLSSDQRAAISFLPVSWQSYLEKQYKLKYQQGAYGPERAEVWLNKVINDVLSINNIEYAFLQDSVLFQVADNCAAVSSWMLDRGIDDFPLGLNKSDVTSKSRIGVELRLRSVKFWYRKLRVIAANVAELASYYLGLTGAATSKYCSQFNVRRHKWRKEKSLAFLKAKKITNGIKTITLDKLASTPKKKSSELYVVAKGLEDMAKSKEHVWLFATMTCPPRMHPNPTRGANSWDGTSPIQAAQWLQKNWTRVRAMLHKSGIRIYGIWSKEPHLDGCPHMHALIYCESRHVPEVQRCLRYHCDRTDKGYRCTAKDDLSSLTKAEKELYNYLKVDVDINHAYDGSMAGLSLAFKKSCYGRMLKELDNEETLIKTVSGLLDSIGQLRYWLVSRNGDSIRICRMPIYKGKYCHMRHYPFDFDACDNARGVIYKTPALEIIQGLPSEKGCSPSSYIQKYIMKATHDGTCSNVEAASSTWKYRRYGIFGIDSSLVLWRQLRRCKPSKVPVSMRIPCWYANNNKYFEFYSSLPIDLVLCTEQFENCYGEKCQKVVGLIDLETNYSVSTAGEWSLIKNENEGVKNKTLVTVKHSYPRGKALAPHYEEIPF